MKIKPRSKCLAKEKRDRKGKVEGKRKSKKSVKVEFALILLNPNKPGLRKLESGT